MVLLIGFGVPARIVPAQLPSWYVLYFGDYLWAMLLFFLFALTLRNMGTFKVAIITLSFTYIIEISQLFHPQWLDDLRGVWVLALLLGHDFLWSDIVAYTLGISTGALVESLLLRRNAGNT
jgi:hypothetical protein